jgi:membrane-associated phospholipid phosphatase
VKRWAAGGALVAVLVGSPRLANAQVRDLRWDPALDVSVTAGGAALWLASEALKGDLAPSRCHWCSVDPADAAVREALVWRDTGSANLLSDATAFVLLPLAAVGLNALAAAHEGASGNIPEDALLVAEAGVVTADLNQLTKMLVGRERPFVHALPPEQKPSTGSPSDNNLSFFSGHSSETFALAVASGTVASMHGYQWAPVVWGVGGVLAATTAYLRIAADRHWLTDVLVGAVVGAGIGFTLPYVFHSAKDDSPTATTGAALRAPALPLPLMTLAW